MLLLEDLVLSSAQDMFDPGLLPIGDFDVSSFKWDNETRPRVDDFSLSNTAVMNEAINDNARTELRDSGAKELHDPTSEELGHDDMIDMGAPGDDNGIDTNSCARKIECDTLSCLSRTTKGKTFKPRWRHC